MNELTGNGVVSDPRYGCGVWRSGVSSASSVVSSSCRPSAEESSGEVSPSNRLNKTPEYLVAGSLTTVSSKRWSKSLVDTAVEALI